MPEFVALSCEKEIAVLHRVRYSSSSAWGAPKARRYFIRAITCDVRYPRAYIMLVLSLFGRSGYEYALTIYKRMRIFARP